MKAKNHKRLLELLRVDKHEFHKLIRSHIEERNDKETVARTLINLNGWYKKFKMFLYEYDRRNITLNNKSLGSDYVEWLESKGYANSYVQHHFKQLQATLNRLEIHHNFNFKELFRGYAKESKANEDMFMTNEEVKQLLNYKNYVSELELIVLHRFIIACFTGCRKSEITSIDVASDKTLSYVSSKTKKALVVPYAKQLKPYIESGHYLLVLSVFDHANANDVLHKLFKRLGWDSTVVKYRLEGKTKRSYEVPRYDAITFHSARKFFGKMLLDMDVSMYKVSQLLGHSSIDTTQKYYASVTREKMMEETGELINNF